MRQIGWLRAIREIICRAIQDKWELSEVNATIQKRLAKLKKSKTFLPLTDSAIDLWRDYILKPFCQYMSFENSFDVTFVRTNFPIHYKDFLISKKKDDTRSDLYDLVDSQ